MSNMILAEFEVFFDIWLLDQLQQINRFDWFKLIVVMFLI